MEEIVMMTEVNKDRQPIISELGVMNQLIFKEMKDVLYWLWLHAPDAAEIKIDKYDESFSRVTMGHADEITRYYALKCVKPVSFETKNDKDQ